MGKAPFQFKHFVIHQNNASLKVGTDAMLLGSCIPNIKASSILDIGTGTGVIALMLAQRFSPTLLVALEPDPASFLDAQLNFSTQQFCSSYQLHPTTLQEFHSETHFDLIVSNPPYFDGSYLSSKEEKNNSRHQLNLSFSDLLKGTTQLLSLEGSAWFILPAESKTNFITQAKEENLNCFYEISIYGKPEVLKRIILGFSKQTRPMITNSLIVRDSFGNYTEAYKMLTSEYHGKPI